MKLFPRLPSRFAQDLFAELSVVTLDEVDGSTSHPLLIWPATGADRIREKELSALRASLVEVASQHGYPDPLSRAEQVSLDIDLARALWDCEELSPAEAGFGDVWSFIALVLVPDVVWWRAAGSSNIERFVATDLTRHTLARLWWRAHLFTWGLPNPEEGWELWRSSDIGEAELDQIQTRRGGYGRSPNTFRALVGVYPTVVALADELGMNPRTFWRHAYLRWILRLGAFINFNGIREEELAEDLRAIAAEVGVLAADVAASDEGDDADEGQADEVQHFDALPLNSLVVHLTEAIRAAGEVAREDLSAAFERVTGVEVPPDRAEILSGIAWQGEALKYLMHVDADGVTIWRPGSTLPAPDRRWKNWSINSFGEYAAGQNGAPDVKVLCSELFSGRPGQTVKRVVRAASQKR